MSLLAVAAILQLVMLALPEEGNTEMKTTHSGGENAAGKFDYLKLTLWDE